VQNLVEILDLFVEPTQSSSFDVLYIVTNLHECDLSFIIMSRQVRNHVWQLYLSCESQYKIAL
jgi:hypothetical protein